VSEIASFFGASLSNCRIAMGSSEYKDYEQSLNDTEVHAST